MMKDIWMVHTLKIIEQSSQGKFFYSNSSQVRVSCETKIRSIEKGATGMKDLLQRLKVLEAEMEEVENQSEYWMQEEHFDMEKSNSY